MDVPLENGPVEQIPTIVITVTVTHTCIINTFKLTSYLILYFKSFIFLCKFESRLRMLLDLCRTSANEQTRQ